MIPLLSTDLDIFACQEKLKLYAATTQAIRLDFNEQVEYLDIAHFEIRKTSSSFLKSTTIFHGILRRQQTKTFVEGEFIAPPLANTLFWMWCIGIVWLVGTTLSCQLLLSWQADAIGARLDPSASLLFLIILAFIGTAFLFFVYIFHSIEQRQIIDWLAACFSVPSPTFPLAHLAKKGTGLSAGLMIMVTFAVGVVAVSCGTFFGAFSLVEEYLPPLAIKVTQFSTCAQSNQNQPLVQQSVFSASDKIYACGHLTIQEVDQRKVSIPLIFTWRYEAESEQARAIQYEFERDQQFVVLLDRPVSGDYEPGKYQLTVGRGKMKLAGYQFTVVAN